jgi:hypothetical protein
MNRVKGISSAFLNGQGVRGGEEGGLPFRWQPDYGVFSVEPSLVGEKIAYLRDQKRHHTEGTARPAREEPDEPVVVDTPD